MAIITCPNCGEEISDQASLCHNCKTPMSVILSQNPKRKRTTPLLVPVLSVLDGLVLVGTVGLLTWGAMNPAITALPQTENASSYANLAAACETISTLQRNAAKNYNRYYSDNIDTAEAQILSVEPETGTEAEPKAVELVEDQDALQADETAPPAVQSGTPQQTAPEPQQNTQEPQQPVAPVQETSPPAPSAETTTQTTSNNERDFSGGRVLATTVSNNNNDPVYHTRNCASAQRIAKEDEYWYDSEDAAKRDNRRKCKRC